MRGGSEGGLQSRLQMWVCFELTITKLDSTITLTEIFSMNKKYPFYCGKDQLS